jgi:rhodanese-related sulfurtransferase
MNEQHRIGSLDEFVRVFLPTQGLVIDLREVREFESSHIPDALNLNLLSKDFIQFFEKLNKDAAVLLYCEDGTRSNVAYNFLKEQGFRNVYSLAEGLSSWDGQLVEE